MAKYCLRNCMLEAVAQLVLVPSMDSFLLPRLAPWNFDLGCQQHVETHSLVQSNPWEYLASMLGLRNVHWAPCCYWAYTLLTKLHNYPFLSLNLCISYNPSPYTSALSSNFSSLTSGCTNLIFYWSIKHIRSWTWFTLKNKTQPACWNMLVSC